LGNEGVKLNQLAHGEIESPSVHQAEEREFPAQITTAAS